MGDGITRPAKSDEQARARLLREALQRGAPTLSIPAHRTTAISGKTSSAIHAEDGELQKAYFEQMLECAPEAISILDAENRVLRVNREFTRIFGFQPEEVTGRGLASLILPPD